MSQFQQQLHPELPNPTTLWGYRDTTQAVGSQTHLGGMIVTSQDQPVRIRFTNELPPTHILPVDTTIPGAETARPRTGPRCISTAVWSPGPVTAAPSTGGPPSDGPRLPSATGASFLNGPGGFLDILPGYNTMGPGQADYLYPNDQSYRLMWYHDHALGITRLNAYAGIATGYLIRDAVVANLENKGMIPPLSRLIPLVFQDKVFIPVHRLYPRPGGAGGPGDLWYPSVYDGGRRRRPDHLALPIPSCVPEFFGDTMLVNGSVYPYVEVEQRKYRFLALNACNARFLRIKLVAEDPSQPRRTPERLHQPHAGAGLRPDTPPKGAFWPRR